MELPQLLDSDDKQLERSTTMTNEKSIRQRLVLSKQQAVEIFRLKSCHGFPTSHAASAHLAILYKVSSKSIRDIWNGRSWLNATFDMWDEGNRPNRRIVGRPKGKRDSRPRLSKAHAGLKTVTICSRESDVSASQSCRKITTAPQNFPDPLHMPTFPLVGDIAQVSAMRDQRSYAFLDHLPMRSPLGSQNTSIYETLTGFRPYPPYAACQGVFGLYPSTSLAPSSFMLPWHPCPSNIPWASEPRMQMFLH
jgi:hypothetical protein